MTQRDDLHTDATGTTKPYSSPPPPPRRSSTLSNDGVNVGSNIRRSGSLDMHQSSSDAPLAPLNATNFYGNSTASSAQKRRQSTQHIPTAAIEDVNSNSISPEGSRRKSSYDHQTTTHAQSGTSGINRSSDREVLRVGEDVNVGRATELQQQRPRLPPPPMPAPPPPLLGINLDDDDTVFPASPVPEEMIEDYNSSSAFPLPPIGHSALQRNQDPQTINFKDLGPGCLPNAILGHSAHEGFHLGHVFDWHAGFAENLVDYAINPSFVCLPPPPRPRQASQFEASTSTLPVSPASPAPSSSSRSYSQALGTRSIPEKQTELSGQEATTTASTANTPSKNRDGPQGNGFSNKLLQESRPHPYAYYNVKSHAWTILAPWRQSPLRRREDTPATCNRPGNSRKTHHYIRVQRSIDPKLVLKQTDREENVSRQSGGVSVHTHLGGPSSAPWPDPTDHHDPAWLAPDTPSEGRWDLFICSGCRNAFTVSPEDYVPSCIGRQLCEEFGRYRIADVRSQTNDGQTDAAIIRSGLEYIWKVLRNALYHNNTSLIPIAGATYKKRLGTNPAACSIFERCGFTSVQSEGRELLAPPKLTPHVVLQLTRTFLEISLWLAHISRSEPSGSGQTVSELVLLKPIESAIEQVSSSDVVDKDRPTGDEFSNTYGFSVHYRILGVTPETSDGDIVHAYNWQLETHFEFRAYYLDSLKEIACMRGEKREALQLRLAMESSNDRYGQSELQAAYRKLGMQPTLRDGSFFGLNIYENVSEDIVMDAYETAKAAVPLRQGTESDLKELRDALSMLAKQTQSVLLSTVLESEVAVKPSIPAMTIDECYTYLQASKDTPDDMLCNVLNINYFTDPNISDYQKDKAKAALTTIGQARNSSAIDHFLQTGMLPEAIEAPREAPVSEDRPAGLQNIGNTCYLNSLLQYFFTIEQLRQIVLDFDRYKETRSPEEVARLKKVGGRRVTQREIERSKKFTALLADLFRQLISRKVSSVKPERDLAYLALVSSKDEDESTSPVQPTGSAMRPLDAVVEASASDMKVDEVSESLPDHPTVSPEGLSAAQHASGSPTAEAGSPSVLGKRNSEQLDDTDDNVMHIDEQTVSQARDSDGARKSKTTVTAMVAQAGEDGVVEIVPAQETRDKSPGKPADAQAAPPLPPRRQSSTSAGTNMMFGRQNDVSEAMDNVIFQIEVALDDSLIPKPDIHPTLAGEPCSFVQSLFYGTAKQTLKIEGPNASVRTKEEAFSYLLVDVAEDGTDLHDGLDSFFQASTVEIDGSKAERQDVLTQLPPILQVQLQRVQFDRTTSRIYKSNAYMPFPRTLYMGRYLSPDGKPADFVAKQNATKRLRDEITALQTKIRKLEQKDEEQKTLPELLTITAESLKDLARTDDSEGNAFLNQLRQQLNSDDGDVLSMLSEHASAIEKDIIDARQRLDACRRELDSLWNDDVDNEYELSSVFIHLGAAGYGHYYLYQRALPEQPNRWLKFNDESVTDVEESEVFADTTGATANPYWLTYVKKSEIDFRIDAVCRRFVE